MVLSLNIDFTENKILRDNNFQEIHGNTNIMYENINMPEFTTKKQKAISINSDTVNEYRLLIDFTDNTMQPTVLRLLPASQYISSNNTEAVTTDESEKLTVSIHTIIQYFMRM